MIRKVFQAFEYREFRLMWLGACTSSIGTWIQRTAQSWLVLELSGRKDLLGLDSFLGEIPILLFSLFGGVASDRFDRRKILIGSQLGQMLAAFILALLFFTGYVQVWHILMLSFLTGLSQAFGGPAYQAILPMIVPKASIQNAIAMNSLQFNVARVLGPSIAGIALAKLGAAWCFTLNGVSFLAVITALLLISEKRGTGSSTESVLESIKEGVRYVRDKPGMLSLIVIAFAMTACALPLITYLPVMVKEVYRQGATGFTTLLVISGLGSITGALVVAGLGNLPNKGFFALWSLVALGGLVIVFALSTNLWLSYAALFLASGLLMCAFAFMASLAQNMATDEMRGRVMSLYNVAFRGGGPLGAVICGELMQSTSVQPVLAGCGILLAALGAWFLLVQRRVANL